MPYELSTASFNGPIEKLLALIEERKLDITEVSLAKVTDDFLRYLEANRAIEPALLAEFVAVASRLVLIKSKVLLPDLVITGEEEAQIHDLERRLAFYKMWKPAEKLVIAAFASRAHLRSRSYFEAAGAAFYPSPGLTADALVHAFEEVAQAISALVREKETVKGRIIAVEEMIAEIIARLAQGAAMNFRTAAGARPTSEVVALFLAVLHLAREGRVLLEQPKNFSDIIVSHSGKTEGQVKR